MIKVLIVDDSPTVREYLAYIIDLNADMKVIGTAPDGKKALELVRRERPDVITMDINMPKMNGLEATRRIMEETPVPILIVTASWDVRDVQTTFMAMEAGALAALERPRGIANNDAGKGVGELITAIRLMSEVKVVRRTVSKDARSVSALKPDILTHEVKLVAIGASTGGPMVIRTILSRLPESFSIPIVIVQHMTAGFLQGFTDWLDNDSLLSVSIANDGQHLEGRHVYIAPDGLHLGIDTNGNVLLSNDGPEYSMRPSVSYLFRSVANVYGKSAIGVLLTGMGKDGARELKMMKDRGAVTIAQDRESSVVNGMPGAAVACQAVTHVLTPEEIAETLIRIIEERGKTTDEGRRKGR